MKPHPNRTTWTDEMLNKAIELSKVMTKREAAKVLGVTYGNLDGACSYYGISFGHPGKPKKSAKLTTNDVINIRVLFDAGLSRKDIAEKFDISRQYVSKIVRGVERIYG